jgi:hypothetical protein
MKKMLAFTTLTVVLIFAATLILAPSNAVSSSKSSNPSVGNPIPDSIGTIIEKSCYPCHSAPGNGMAMSHLNFDKWDNYSPEKQANKANAMCKKVTAGKMPTGSFRKNNPDKVPTEKEVTMLCNWANSLQKK